MSLIAYPGAGAGTGFQLFTQSDGISGVYADAAARDVYFDANQSEVNRVADNQNLIIKLLDNGSGEIAFQQYNGTFGSPNNPSDWLDVTSLVQGETGPAGATGNSYFFESIAARDAFFNTVGNEALLMTDLPVVVNEGTAVTTFIWTGVDSPSTYDEDLFIEHALNTGPGTLFLGLDGANLSSAGEGVNFTTAYGDLAIAVGTLFSEKGSIKSFGEYFTNDLILSVADVFDTQLSDPQNFAFLSVALNSYTEGLNVRPATAGVLRLRGYAGSDDTFPILEDTRITITAPDIGNIITIPITGILSRPGTDFFIVLSGVDLFGGVQTSGIFNGQTKPFLESISHFLEEFRFLDGRDLDQYISLNPEYTTAAAKTGGIVVNTLPTATTDTFTDSGFTPGVASTSNPTLDTDGSATFSSGDIILILRGTQLLDSDLNDGIYEVLTHVGIVLTVKGIGTAPTTEDFIKDQFFEITSTGTITKIDVSVLRANTSGDWEVGQGATTQLTYEGLTTTPDTLDNLTMLVGAGTNSIQAADASGTTANISTNSAFDEILITAAVDGDASYKLLDSSGTIKTEFFYEDDNDTNIWFSSVELFLSSSDSMAVTAQTTLDFISTTGDITFNTQTTLSSDGQILTIEALTNGDAALRLLDDTSSIKAEFFYEDDNDTNIWFSAVELFVSSADSMAVTAQTTLDLSTSTGAMTFVAGSSTITFNSQMELSSDGTLLTMEALSSGEALIEFETPASGQALLVGHSDNLTLNFITSAFELDIVAASNGINIQASDDIMELSTTGDITLDATTGNILLGGSSDARVGVGTDTPLANLHIVTSGTSGLGGVPATRGLAISGNDGFSRIFFENITGTAGQRTFQISNEGGDLCFSALNDTGGSFVHQNIIALDHVTGFVGINTDTPTTLLDIDSSNTVDALRLRSGNIGAVFDANQIILSFNGQSNFSHAIKTRHQSANPIENAIDFFVWDQTVDADADIGTLQVMSLCGTGFVGIGTTVPTELLTVESGNILQNPGDPVLLGSLTDSTNLDAPNGVFVANSYAYIASIVSDSLSIVDVSDPTAPVLVGTVSDATNLNGARGIQVAGKFAYIVGNAGTVFSIVDVSDPSTPTITGTLIDGTNFNGAFGVQVGGKFAYVSAGNADTISVLDISDPTTPVIVGTVTDGSNLNSVTRIHLQGQFVYAGSFQRVNVIDVSDPTTPVIVGTVVDAGNLGTVSDVYVSGAFAYAVSDGVDSINVIDVSDPTTPVIVGTLTDGTNLNRPQRICVAGNLAYIVTISSGVVVVDISDPTTPVIVGSLTGLNMQGMHLVGKILYAVSQGTDTLQIIDVTGIDAPTATIGAIETNVLSVKDNAVIYNNLSVGGLNVGFAGIHSDGVISTVELDVAGDMNITGDIILTPITGDAEIIINDSSSVEQLRISHLSGSAFNKIESQIELIIETDTEDLSLISDTGNVGLSAADGNIVLNSTNGNIIFQTTSGDIAFKTNALFVASGTDFVGVGTVSPAVPLDVVESTADTASIFALETTGTNGGRAESFVGDRDPDGNITGASGDQYLRANGALSGSYESHEATTGTNWLKRLVNPTSAIEILTAAQFDDLASGGIITITVNTTFHLKGAIVSSSRIVVNSGISFTITSTHFAGNSIVYVGTDTFLTTDGGSIRILAAAVLISGSTGTLLSFAGTGTFNATDIALIGWDDLGTFSEGIFLNSNLSYVNCDAGWDVTDPSLVSVFRATQVGSPMTAPLFTYNTKEPASSFALDGVVGTSISAGVALVDLNGRINKDSSVVITGGRSLTGDIFKQSSLTDATINSVADGTISNGTITAQADNGSGGTTHSSTTTYFEDEEVTISGTTSYDGTFQIFNVVAGVSFDTITDFVADDATGTVASVRIAVTLAGGHGISIGDQLKVIDTNFYNGFRIALNVATNVLTLNDDFVSTNTGSIEREVGLDQTDPRVVGIANFGEADSSAIACAHVNDNSTANGAIVNNTFTGMVFGTTGTALLSSSTMERWRLVDELNSTFEFIGTVPFNGYITFDFTVTSSGGTVDFRFKWEISTDGGSSFSDLTDAVESLVAVGSDAQSVTKTFPLAVFPGDQIRPQITRNSGTSGITTSYATIYATE